MSTLRIASEIALVWLIGGLALAAIKRSGSAQRLKAVSWLIFAALLAFPAGRIALAIHQIEARRDHLQGTDTCYYRIGNSRRSYPC